MPSFMLTRISPMAQLNMKKRKAPSAVHLHKAGKKNKRIGRMPNPFIFLSS